MKKGKNAPQIIISVELRLIAKPTMREPSAANMREAKIIEEERKKNS